MSVPSEKRIPSTQQLKADCLGQSVWQCWPAVFLRTADRLTRRYNEPFKHNDDKTNCVLLTRGRTELLVAMPI